MTWRLLYILKYIGALCISWTEKYVLHESNLCQKRQSQNWFVISGFEVETIDSLESTFMIKEC